MARRDEQGLKFSEFTQAVSSNNIYTVAHGIDTSKVISFTAFARDTSNGLFIPNGNLGKYTTAGTSDFTAYMTSTDYVIDVPSGETNLDGANVIIHVRYK